MRTIGTAAAVLLAAAVPAAGQSLVVSTGDLTVAASYGYSQLHHDEGAWILIDVGLRSSRYGTIRPARTFTLMTPDGDRIDLPDQKQFRAGLKEIQAMTARAATMQLSPWLAIPDCMVHSFIGWSLVPGGGLHSDHCRNWRLWGNGGIDWTATVGPSTVGGASLFFESPSGDWPAGQYSLIVDGPGDLEARLPIRLQ